MSSVSRHDSGGQGLAYTRMSIESEDPPVFRPVNRARFGGIFYDRRSGRDRRMVVDKTYTPDRRMRPGTRAGEMHAAKPVRRRGLLGAGAAAGWLGRRPHEPAIGASASMPDASRPMFSLARLLLAAFAMAVCLTALFCWWMQPAGRVLSSALAPGSNTVAEVRSLTGDDGGARKQVTVRLFGLPFRHTVFAATAEKVQVEWRGPNLLVVHGSGIEASDISYQDDSWGGLCLTYDLRP